MLCRGPGPGRNGDPVASGEEQQPVGVSPHDHHVLRGNAVHLLLALHHVHLDRRQVAHRKACRQTGMWDRRTQTYMPVGPDRQTDRPVRTVGTTAMAPSVVNRSWNRTCEQLQLCVVPMLPLSPLGPGKTCTTHTKTHTHTHTHIITSRH